MNSLEIIIGAVVTILAGAGGMFATLRYVVNEGRKNQEELMKFVKNNQEQFIDYIKNKNGHMERVANKFTDSSDRMTATINALSAHIERLSDKLK